MLCQQFFISLAHEKVNFGAGEKACYLFHQRRRKHDVADKRRLNDQKLH